MNIEDLAQSSLGQAVSRRPTGLIRADRRGLEPGRRRFRCWSWHTSRMHAAGPSEKSVPGTSQSFKPRTGGLGAMSSPSRTGGKRLQLAGTCPKGCGLAECQGALKSLPGRAVRRSATARAPDLRRVSRPDTPSGLRPDRPAPGPSSVAPRCALRSPPSSAVTQARSASRRAVPDLKVEIAQRHVSPAPASGRRSGVSTGAYADPVPGFRWRPEADPRAAPLENPSGSARAP